MLVYHNIIESLSLGIAYPDVQVRPGAAQCCDLGAHNIACPCHACHIHHDFYNSFSLIDLVFMLMFINFKQRFLINLPTDL